MQGCIVNKTFPVNHLLSSREDVFITSKLWNTDHEPHLVEETCRKQMADLQVNVELSQRPMMMPSYTHGA